MWQRYCLLFLLVFLPFVSLAQFGNFENFNNNGREPSIITSPSFPGPGQSYTATIEDAAGSVFGSQITWMVNGTQLNDVTNRRTVNLVAPAAGEQATLTAVLNTADGKNIRLSKTIQPIYLDIIIEPQTRVPDWYQGRSLPSTRSQINATVLLHNGTSFLDSNIIVYSWTVDGEPLENGPIRGGYKVSFETPSYGSRPVLIVNASDLRGNTIARRAVQMNSVTPDLEFYEKHSLYGQRTKPLQTNTALVGNVITLQAEPYNLDTRVYNNPDIAQWEINSIETDNGVSNPYEITLSRAGVGGRTVLNFHVRSLEQILQGAEDDLIINF
jgi:hypothetical protein